MWLLPCKAHNFMLTGSRMLENCLRGPIQYASYNIAMTFTYNDLLLGSKPQNCPLFMTTYIREQKVNVILMDGGLAVNIIPKSAINDLGTAI